MIAPVAAPRSTSVPVTRAANDQFAAAPERVDRERMLAEGETV